MKQYIDLLKLTLEQGRIKKDRTGTGTIGVFGAQMRFKMSDGFPLLVLKNTHFSSVLAELIWFLKGDTNIQWLERNNCSIWRDWPYKKYLEKNPTSTLTIKEFGEQIKGDDFFAKTYGDLGPVYGKQWVKWDAPGLDVQNISEDGLSKSGEFWLGEEDQINQIQKAVDTLKTNPEDRGIIISAWNVAELKDMALRPCHAFFQFDTFELSHQERWEMYRDYIYTEKKDWALLPPNEIGENHFKSANIPKHKLSLHLYQRSCDMFLGVPFNIASYSLLLHMVSQCVGMLPDEFIWTGGDVHVYSNHIAQCRELFDRYDNLPLDDKGIKIEPTLPKIKLNSEIKNIFDFKIEDIKLENYKPMKSIKAPVAV